MNPPSLAPLLAALLLASSVLWIGPRGTDPGWTRDPPDPVGQQDGEPRAAVGQVRCATCHAFEVASIGRTKHGKSLDTLNPASERVIKFREALGETWASGRPPEQSACVRCHGSVVSVWNEGEVARHVQAITCESCHGPAGEPGGRPSVGAPRGWLNPHASFGAHQVPESDQFVPCTRSEESPDHREQNRWPRVRAAGMLRSAEIYDLALRCYGCHFVANEKLVADGGHSAGHDRFEFLSWSLGEVRHNFLLNAETNAQTPANSELSTLARFYRPGRDAVSRKRIMYVLGQMARLETGLRVLVEAGAAEQETVFDNAWDKLVEPVKELFEEDDDLQAACPQIAAVVTAIEDVEDWKDEFEDSKEKLGQAADLVRREALALDAQDRVEGDGWSFVDEQIEELESKGEALDPSR